MSIESKCNGCFWNFGGVCASHCNEIELNGGDTYGMSITDTAKLFPFGCSEYRLEPSFTKPSFTDADLGNHAIDVQNDMGYYDDITGRYVPYTFPNDEY